MSASTMAAQGEKTRAKILKKLGKKPKSAATIAESLGLSATYVRETLNGAADMGKARAEKKGREMLYTAVDFAAAYKSVGSITD